MSWISIHERHPETRKWVLCRNEDNDRPFIGIFTTGNQIEAYDYNEDETIYLGYGWYELCEQLDGAYDEHYFKRTVTVWQYLPL